MNRRVAFLCLALIVSGCGASKEAATVTVTTTTSVQSEAVVHVYFRTIDTFPRNATHSR